MTEICRQHCLVRMVVIVLTTRLVACYENAYDLSERRNQFRNDPNNRYYETSERYYNRDRYSTHNRRPSSVYSSVRPGDPDPGFVTPRRTSLLGNGYDNLGNSGIDGEFSSRFRNRNWNRSPEPIRFDKLNDRGFDNRRRWDSTRNADFLEDRRPLGDSFRTRGRFDDRRGDDSFGVRGRFDDRRVDDSFGVRGRFDDRRGDDSFRNLDSYDDRRSIDPVRDINQFEDRPSLDLSRNPDSLDDRRTIDAFREIADRDPPRKLAETTLDEPLVLDLSKRGSSIESDSFRPRLQPVHRRREYPQFYRKDYFVHRTPVGEKSVGFETENSDKTFQTAAGGKENSGLSTVGSYVTSNEDKNQKKTDTGFHDNKEGAKLDIANKEKIGETTRVDKNGGNKSTVRSNRVNKKGHSTKGFATHHHKDETGNSTTFFDESSDIGGQSDYQDLEDEFGTRRTMEVLNGKEDGRFFQENGGRTGNFGSGVLKDNKKVEKDIVANDNRFNKEERFGDGQDHIDRGFKTASEYLGGGVWGDHH